MSGNLPEAHSSTGANLLRESYISIPIPQREREEPNTAKPRRSIRSLLPKIRFQRKARQPLSPIQKIRRKEFIQSIFAAACLNLIIGLALLSIVIDPLDFSDGAIFTANLTNEEENDQEEAKDAGGAAAAKNTAAGNPGAANISGLNSATSMNMAITPPSLNLPSLTFDETSPVFGQSVIKSDFAAIESAERRRMREFVYGNGSHHAGGAGHGSGVSEGVLQGLFPKSKLGDGSQLAVFVDMSGSMQEISQAVDAYIERVFPKGVTRHILGCALNSADDPFLRAMASEAKREKRTDFYFICDLQDGETGEGIGRIQNHLILGEIPKRLHIISFDKPPSHYLSNMLEVTNGTFTYIDPTLDSKEK